MGANEEDGSGGGDASTSANALKDKGTSEGVNQGQEASCHDKVLPLKPIAHLLREHGVEDWDPRVVYQLLELQYRSTKVLLDKSKRQSIQARGSQAALTCDDVRMTLAFEEEEEKLKKKDPKKIRDVNKQPLPRLTSASSRIPLPQGWFSDDDLNENIYVESTLR